MPANILNLAAYSVIDIAEDEDDYHIDAEAKKPPACCPHCQSDNLIGFGRREQMIRDMPMHGRRVGLYIDTRRYRCRACDKTFYEPLPEINEKRLMTQRLVDWIGKRAVKHTFASIAEEVGIDEKTVRLVFGDYVNALEATIRFETPKWMGIDEIHLIKPRSVIANIQNNTIVERLAKPEQGYRGALPVAPGRPGTYPVRCHGHVGTVPGCVRGGHSGRPDHRGQVPRRPDGERRCGARQEGRARASDAQTKARSHA